MRFITTMHVMHCRNISIEIINHFYQPIGRDKTNRGDRICFVSLLLEFVASCEIHNDSLVVHYRNISMKIINHAARYPKSFRNPALVVDVSRHHILELLKFSSFLRRFGRTLFRVFEEIIFFPNYCC